MKNDEFSHIIGERIRSIRKSLGMSQLDLAFEAGINTTYLSDIERGAVNVSVRVLYSIVTALKIDLSEFFSAFPSKGENIWQTEIELSELLAELRKLDAKRRRVAINTLKALLKELS